MYRIESCPNGIRVDQMSIWDILQGTYKSHRDAAKKVREIYSQSTIKTLRIVPLENRPGEFPHLFE